MTTWVLLRGLIREKRHWGEFPARFQDAIGAEVVTLDFPGNGRFHAQSSAATVPAMANSIRTRLSQSGCPPPYSVLALSLGAMAAVAWSEMYPAELERMVLISTSLAPYSPFYHRLRPANYPGLFRFLLHDSPAQRERLVLRLTSNLKSTEQQQAILEQWIAYARECPVTRANILCQLTAAARFRASTHPPAIPTLLLAAQQDHLVDVQCSLTLARQWNCPLRIHPTAGHDIPLDDSDWVTQRVREWLSA
jgi:alpha-beta hydrolase superfamily lysophospholipase